MRELTWRQLDVMDRARRVFAWDLVASLKAFLAATEGVTIAPDVLNPERAADTAERPKVKPSQVGLDGNVISGGD